MEFFIRQDATMPSLQLELLQDGIQGYNKQVEQLENATVTFSMQEVNSCVKKIICKPMIVEDCTDTCQECFPKYKLVYNFTSRDTNSKGRYEGTIEVNFLDGCGKLILPIHEKLFINVV